MVFLPGDAWGWAQSRNDGIEDRDIVWFVIGPRGVSSNYGRIDRNLEENARSHLSDGHEGLEVVLIGKDGSEKLRAASLDLDSIFARIDAMPMRRREMGIDA